MKRLTTMMAGLLTLVGALGLCLFGNAIAQLQYDVYTFRLTDPPDPLPNSLQVLPLAMLSAMAVVGGFLISIASITILPLAQRLSVNEKLLGGGAALMPIIAIFPLAWGVIVARQALMELAQATLPSPDEFEATIKSSEQLLLVGFVLLVISAVLLLISVLWQQAKKSAMDSKPGQPRGFTGFMVGAVFVGLVAFVLLGGAWFDGTAIVRMLGSRTPEPAALAGHMSGILIKSLLAFVSISALGLLGLLALLLRPKPTTRQVANV